MCRCQCSRSLRCFLDVPLCNYGNQFRPILDKLEPKSLQYYRAFFVVSISMMHLLLLFVHYVSYRGHDHVYFLPSAYWPGASDGKQFYGSSRTSTRRPQGRWKCCYQHTAAALWRYGHQRYFWRCSISQLGATDLATLPLQELRMHSLYFKVACIPMVTMGTVLFVLPKITKINATAVFKRKQIKKLVVSKRRISSF